MVPQLQDFVQGQHGAVGAPLFHVLDGSVYGGDFPQSEVLGHMTQGTGQEHGFVAGPGVAGQHQRLGGRTAGSPQQRHQGRRSKTRPALKRHPCGGRIRLVKVTLLCMHGFARL